MTRGERLRGIVACIASTTTATVTLGLTLPYLALVLDRWGVPPWINGLSAAAQMVAVMAFAYVGPRLMARFGTKRVITGGLFGVALSLLLLPLFPDVWIWFPIRFLLGFASELVWTTGDVWINQLAPDDKRGRIVGTTGFFQHGGFAVGPLLLVIMGTESWLPLHVGIAIVLMGLLPLLVAGRAVTSKAAEAQARVLHFLRLVPGLMVAGLMFGLIDSAILTLLPVYGLRKGLDAGMAEGMLSIFVVGAMLAQVPMGWLTERIDGLRLMLAGALLTFVMLLWTPWAIVDPVLIYPVLGAMGAGLGGFYIIALVEIGRRFKGPALIGVTTSFMFLWATGSVVGPGLAGLAIDLGGPDAMPATAAVLTAAFMLLLFALRRRRSPSGPGR